MHWRRRLCSRFDPCGTPPTVRSCRPDSATFERWGPSHSRRLLILTFLASPWSAFEVTQFVPRDELWSHLVMSCYGFDALPDDTARAALATIGLPDPVPWTTPLVEITARA